jgi:hypothetical protein
MFNIGLAMDTVLELIYYFSEKYAETERIILKRLLESPFAQFIAICRSSILAETLAYAVKFSSLWRGKRRVLEGRKPVLLDQLQPSTNADKLSESVWSSPGA